MGREVFADPASAATLERMFIPVRVMDRTQEEGRNSPEVSMLQARYRVDAFPTLVVAAADGRELGRLEGYPGRSRTIGELTKVWTRTGIGGRRREVRLRVPSMSRDSLPD
jgi:hypothetical protein